MSGGFFVTCAILSVGWAGSAAASDGATEALELRWHAEHAIVNEAAHGDQELASIMQELLPGLLVEDLLTRDETVALDTVDAAFVEEQFGLAEAMEEPGVAMALSVFAGPGTGYEHGVRTALTNLADFHVEDIPSEPTHGRAVEVHERVHEQMLQRQLGSLDRFDVQDARLDAALDALAAPSSSAANFTLSVTPPSGNVSVLVTPSESVVISTPGASVVVTPGSGAQVDPVNGNGGPPSDPPGNPNPDPGPPSDPPGQGNGNGKGK